MAQRKMLSTRDISKKDIVDPKRKMEAQVWVETVLGRKLNGDFFDAIKDGTVLCELLNKIKPETCKKFKKSSIVFVARNNIAIFIKGAKSIGVPQTDVFETRDLFEKQRLSAVVQCIYAVSAKSRKIKSFGGPYIGVSYAEANKRHFTQAQLNKSKSAIPMLNRGDKETGPTSVNDSYGIVKNAKVSKQKISSVQSVWQQGAKQVNKTNMDGYGIVKTKNTKHSGVQSVWEQGSKHIDTSGKQDSYGIVKTKMNQHSGVQSVWEAGSKNIDTSGKQDSYGIVKTKMNQHSGVQSVWQQGSKQINKKNMDSYGIVKTDNTKHSGVQSVWEQGSKQVDKSSKHDSYGIIKNQNQTKHSGVQSVWEQGSKTYTSKKQDSYGIIKTND